MDLILNVPVDVADGKLTLVVVSPERTKSQSAKTVPSKFTFRFDGSI